MFLSSLRLVLSAKPVSSQLKICDGLSDKSSLIKTDFKRENQDFRVSSVNFFARLLSSFSSFFHFISVLCRLINNLNHLRPGTVNDPIDLRYSVASRNATSLVTVNPNSGNSFYNDKR